MKRAWPILLLFVFALCGAAHAQTWDLVETRNFMIYAPPDQIAVAERLGMSAEKIRADTVQAVGFDFKHKTTVYLAPDQETYQSIQPRAKIPEWSVGVAFEDQNLIVIYTPAGARKMGFNYDMITVFHHELCHIVLGRALRDVPIPRWLNEGFAKQMAGEWSTRDSFRMMVAYMMGSLIPLEDLMSYWPSDKNKARLAYLQSKVFVGYLSQRGYLPQIIRWMQKGKTADQAVMLATGYPMSVLEKRWQGYLRRTNTWMLSLFRPEVVWTGMALLFLFAYWTVRIRSKRKLRKMELEDQLTQLYEESDDDDDPAPPEDKTTYH